jgi:hypothetical protein
MTILGLAMTPTVRAIMTSQLLALHQSIDDRSSADWPFECSTSLQLTNDCAEGFLNCPPEEIMEEESL